MTFLRPLTLIGLFTMMLPAISAESYDLVVYGGTSAGIISAVQAKKMGKSVVIVGPDKHLGGLTSGGLGWTDTGNKAVIGGLARDFYHRIWKEYQKEETWTVQKKSEYGGKGQGTSAIDGKNRTMWIFEPRVAEKVYDDYVREFKIPVHRDEWLDRANGVKKEGGKISGSVFLQGCSIGTEEPLILLLVTEKKQYRLRCSTEEEMAGWQTDLLFYTDATLA